MATLADMAGTGLVVREHNPTPLLPMEPGDAAAMMARYRELCESILTPDDVIGIPGQPGGFIKRSGFSKLATYYGVSTEILTQSMTRDAEDAPRRASARVRASSVTGRYADGDGACAITEPRFKNEAGRQKAEHDVMATAVTRATNRAISNLIGFGSVSAEEAEDDAGAHPYGAPASPAQEDGFLRALEDLGADAVPAKRLVERAGYIPKIVALAVMWTAVSVKDLAQEGQPITDDEPIEANAEDAMVDAIKEAFNATEEGARTEDDFDPTEATLEAQPKPKPKPKRSRRYGQPPAPADATEGQSPADGPGEASEG